MTPAELDIEIVRGLTLEDHVLTLCDPDDLVVDITGWSVSSSAKECNNGLILDLEPVITDAAAGQITIVFTDEETALMKLGTYIYDIYLEDDTGHKLGLFLTGTLTIIDKITR